MSENDAKTTLKANGLKAQRILDEAAKHCVSLRGRVKWTSMYAENISDKLKEAGLSDSDTITDPACEALDLRGLAEETYENVVSHLVHRLGIIQERGNRAELLNKLLEAAISVDIRGIPHVFQHERDLELVDQGFAVVATEIDQLPGELAQYFTVITRDTNQLTLRLRNGCDVEQGIIHLLAKAVQRKFTIAGCTINACTPTIATEGFTVVDCKPSKLLTVQAKAGYAKSMGRRTKVEAKLSQNFDITRERKEYLLFAKLKPNTTMKPTLADELQKGDYVIANMTIDGLTNLVRRNFTVKNTMLVAELKERVAVDAILRFFHAKLEEKLICSIMGVSTRTGLGHPAEYFLAVQIRQFFTGLPLIGNQLEEEWQERRGRVLACLAEAENNADERRKIQGLEDSTIILGNQTVKKAGSWNDWVSQLLEWLEAIEKGHKPCASFLLPHNDFGPDIIFALRGKDGNVVLCSIQLKMGAGDPDAVNKSSISWACVGKPMKTRKELKEDKLELTEVTESQKKLVGTVDEQLRKPQSELQIAIKKNKELGDVNPMHGLKRLELQLANPFWKRQCKLSLLVAAGSHIPEEMKKRRPETQCDEAYEYYSYISGAAAEDLFGKAFVGVLRILKN